MRGSDLDRARVLDGLRVAVVVQNAAAEILYANDEAARLLGVSSAQELYRLSSYDPRWDAIHPDGTPIPGAEHPVPRAIATGKPQLDVTMGVRQAVGGERTWLFVSAVPELDDHGNVVRVTTTLRNVTEERRAHNSLRETNLRLELAVAERTAELSRAVDVLRQEIAERERTEKALVESEALYRSVIRAMSEGIVVHESDGAIRMANPSAEKVLGITLDQLQGRSPLDPRFRLVDENGEPLAPESIPSEITKRTGKPCVNVTLGVHRPNGERAWLSVNTDPVSLDVEGSPSAVVATFTDITTERLTKLALEASRAHFKRVTDAVPGLLFQYRVDRYGHGVFTFVSGRAEQMIGIPAARILADAETFWLALHDQDAEDALSSLARAARTATIWEREFRIVVHGASRWMRARAVPEAMESGIEWNGVLLDVTEEHRLGESLRHSQRMEAMGDLAAGIAHNFNNMLGAILPNLDLALEMAPKELEPLLVDARKATCSAAELVRQLLLVARRETDRSREVVDVQTIVEDVAAICRRTFDRRIEIDAQAKADSPVVLGRRSDLHQVILNLCINARDALAGIEAPKLRLAVENGMALLPGRDEAVPVITVVVQDNGIGMDEAVRSRIGEPFFTTKGPDRGTGLGLATAFGIVREFEGTLACDSARGEGTTFRVTFPQLAGVTSSVMESVAARVVLPSRRILVVDDEPLVRRAIVRQLEDIGVEVAEAESGADALQALDDAGGSFSAVLLDLSMPGLPGERVLAEMKSRQPTLPILVMSGHVSEPALLDDATVVLNKPIGRGELLRALGDLLTPAGH
jgi:two-component system cell cycle sensor histidine kinase/response regulator CckA